MRRHYKSFVRIGSECSWVRKKWFLCGVPPAFAGCDAETATPVLERLELAVLEYLREHIAASTVAGLSIADRCSTLLVNDGDASALGGGKWLLASGMDGAAGVFLSCGTGLAGGVISLESGRCGGVLEMGKLIVGLPLSGSGLVPKHDTLGVEGVAQGMAGTQRSFFNLLSARGGSAIGGKAEQRAAIIAMQNRPIDDEIRQIFSSLGTWLAQFVIELSEYLPVKLSHVEAGGKLTDAASGEIMLRQAEDILAKRGIPHVRRAVESEFGQAIAIANEVLLAVE